MPVRAGSTCSAHERAAAARPRSHGQPLRPRLCQPRLPLLGTRAWHRFCLPRRQRVRLQRAAARRHRNGGVPRTIQATSPARRSDNNSTFPHKCHWTSSAPMGADVFSWKRSPGLGALSLPTTGARSRGRSRCLAGCTRAATTVVVQSIRLLQTPAGPYSAADGKGHVTGHAPRGRRMGGSCRVERRGRQSTSHAWRQLVPPILGERLAATASQGIAAATGRRQRPCALSVGRCHAMAVAFHV